MGADDANDQDHVHDWGYATLVVTETGLGVEYECTECGAVIFSPPGAGPPTVGRG